ncbi:uncharacterized protein EV420DRAFT_885224 [Desarmillaria tabescens]|uniref:F-box domain-containing protein n=1 Tax=Armillaria tabescens TaxID=1929756 RepID=A0AA39MUD4_ARMTA|nr:uncharacterized protein EV420DRAFT_885224 [Desarmillaria tabescens]KAK0446987.1 hypothetical protein EV420DRAFT_885224 [Desarmillaria tabescens]
MSLSQPGSPTTPVMARARTLSGSLLKCPECGYALLEKIIAPTLSSSRFEELSSCNDAPLDSELTALETVVREGEANLSSLPRRIAAARETLQILLKEQTRTVKRITDAKVLLNPVRRLPADVLIDIFTECLLEDMDSLDAKSAPWVLSQVCASWRQTALASTELWAHIHLKMDLYENHSQCVFRLGTVLHRAGMHPLKVNIMGRQGFSQHPVFAMILPTSLRWTFLDVIAPLHSFRLFNSISHQLPLLETLSIEVSSAHRSDIKLESNFVVYGFCETPRLRELSLTQRLTSDMSFFPRLFAVPLETISDLTLISTTSDMVSLLQSNREKHMMTFRTLLVDSERHVLPQQIEIPVIRHSCLRFLVLGDSPAGLLSRLRLPALRKLTLLLFKRSILPTLSEHTAPTLTELTVDSSSRSVDGRALANMLQWTPNLTEMTLETVLKTDALFIALGRSSDGVLKLVPHLEIISLEKTVLDFPNPDRVIDDMVEARRVVAPGKRRAALKELEFRNRTRITFVTTLYFYLYFFSFCCLFGAEDILVSTSLH